MNTEMIELQKRTNELLTILCLHAEDYAAREGIHLSQIFWPSRTAPSVKPTADRGVGSYDPVTGITSYPYEINLVGSAPVSVLSPL